MEFKFLELELLSLALRTHRYKLKQVLECNGESMEDDEVRSLIDDIDSTEKLLIKVEDGLYPKN